MNLRRILFAASVLLISAWTAAACGNSGDKFSQGKDPTLSAPDRIAFNEVGVGSSQTKRLTVTNTGSGLLKIDSMDLIEGTEDKHQELFTESWTQQAELEPDQSMTVKIRYSPVDTTADSGKVVIKSNAPNAQPEYVVNLNLSELTPDLDAPQRVNFSSVEPGKKGQRVVSVQNLGHAPLVIQRIQITGKDDDKFSLTYPKPESYRGTNGDKKDDGLNPPKEDIEPQGDSLWPVPGINNEIERNKGVKLRLWYEPTHPRGDTAKLKLFTNDKSVGGEDGTRGVFTIQLSGNSNSPCLRLSHEDTIDFEKSSINKTTKTTVTVDNCRPRSQNLVIQNIELVDDGGGVFELEKSSLPGQLPDKSYEIQGKNRIHFVVSFKPPDRKAYSGKLKIESNDPSKADHTIQLLGEGSDNSCPEAVAEVSVKGNNRRTTQLNTLPLETVQFYSDASNDPDGKVARYEWSILKRPDGSTARLKPKASHPDPTMKLDLAGKYRIELVVYDEDGAASCGNRAVVTIKAIPQEDIHLQLVWDTPQDTDQTDSTGADLDLHYLNPSPSDATWNKAPWDIYWDNKTSDWGQKNLPDDDPSLDIDDTDGAGPENINHDNPQSGKSYAMGVYYYDDHGTPPMDDERSEEQVSGRHVRLLVRRADRVAVEEHLRA
ncbi:MAG: choice-of-anchor D domain-containing protein [Bradymonadaceae bacterium]